MNYRIAEIEDEINSILTKPCYSHGMALYTKDSQRYWELRRKLFELGETGCRVLE